MNFAYIALIFVVLLLGLFSLAHKWNKWDPDNFSIFECGFSSYFFSRFSFSIHYFMIGLIFLFLDMEICLVMTFLMDFSVNSMELVVLFILLLLLGTLFWEWKEGKITWSE